jgi:hypothetical protein
MNAKFEKWTQQEAIDLCKKIEAICPKFGCHVALTGGLLYKEGPRKDCDILFYRIRQSPQIDLEQLWAALDEIGLVKTIGCGWCFKGVFSGKSVDMFFPEEETGPDYPQVDNEDLPPLELPAYEP